MGEDVRGAREFEEPAFPHGARLRAEPPLRIGTWTESGRPDDPSHDDSRERRRDGRADEPRSGDHRGERRAEHRGHAEHGGHVDRRSSAGPGPSAPDDDLGPERMVAAAVPRARGALRVPPGEDGPLVVDPDEESETTVRLVKLRPRAVITGTVEESPRDARAPRDGREAADVPGPREPRDTAWSPHRSTSGASGTSGTSGASGASGTSGSAPAGDPSEHPAPSASPWTAATEPSAEPVADAPPAPGPRSAAARTRTPHPDAPAAFLGRGTAPSAPSAPVPGDPWGISPTPTADGHAGFGGGMGGGVSGGGGLGFGTYAPGASCDAAPYPPVAWFREAVSTPMPTPAPLPSADHPADPHHGPCDSSALEPVGVQKPSAALELRGGRHGTDSRRELEPVPAETPSANEPRTVRSPFEVMLILAAPALALFALLYYFGWARSAAMADFLGFDEDVLGFTTKEYLLRSVDTLYKPMLAVVGVLLAARMAHPYILVPLRRHRRAAAFVSRFLRCAWLLVPVATWAALFRWPGHRPQFWPLLLPLALAAGVLVTAYGVLLSRQVGTHRRATGMGVRPWSLSVVLTSAAVVLCLFWALGAYAQADGQVAALRMVKQLPTRTAVVVYSADDLRVAADQGVTVDVLTGADSPYRYRYAGLRLLRRAHGRLYLLPDRWSYDRPRLVVVREGSSVRVDYLRARPFPPAS